MLTCYHAIHAIQRYHLTLSNLIMTSYHAMPSSGYWAAPAQCHCVAGQQNKVRGCVRVCVGGGGGRFMKNKKPVSWIAKQGALFEKLFNASFISRHLHRAFQTPVLISRFSPAWVKKKLINASWYTHGTHTQTHTHTQIKPGTSPHFVSLVSPELELEMRNERRQWKHFLQRLRKKATLVLGTVKLLRREKMSMGVWMVAGLVCTTRERKGKYAGM